MIPQQEISEAAFRDKVPERTVEKDYVIHWIMTGLSQVAVQKKLAFKGGTALRLCFFKGYRYSEDIDLTAIRPLDKEEFFKAVDEVAIWVRRESAVDIQLNPDSVEQHTDGFSVQVGYRGPLGAAMGRREIKMDISSSEKTAFAVRRRNLIKNYSDVPARSSVGSYSLEEIVCEKFRSLLNPSRREPRDVYDLWYLSENAGLDFHELRPAFRDKAFFKGLDPDKLADTLSTKKKALSALYEKRLEHQLKELPPFDKIFKTVQREARNL